MLAHVGGGSALPAPSWLLSYLGVLLVLGTATALRATWTRARHRAAEARPATAPRVGVGNVIGLLVYAGTVGVALAGPDSTASNVAYWLALVVWWVGLPLVCLVAGDVMRAINPFLPVVALVDRGRSPDPQRPGPAWAPAAFLAVWTWYLLAFHHRNEPRSVAILLLGYWVAAVVGGLRWGRAWLSTGEAFGAISACVARIGLRPRGQRWTAPVPGTAAVMSVWIGSTAFDGFKFRPLWLDVEGTNNGWSLTLLDTVGLVWLTAIVAGAYLLVVRVAERAQREEDQARRLTTALAPALVPLAVGWFLGHDLTFNLIDAQNAYILISDPLGRGWDLFGTYNHTIDYSIATASWPAWVELVLISTGHIGAVVWLHELALQRLSPRAAMRTTWVMAAVACGSITAAALLVLG